MSGYFKGWYFKHQKGTDTLALIPGWTKDGAFIQIVTQNEAHYIPFSKAEDRGAGRVTIGENEFSPEGISLSIHTKDVELTGAVRYGALSPISGDIMGPFRFFPMECRHHVVSMGHSLEGALTLNGQPLDFSGGKGYLEGDEGRSFPKSYTWVQGNDFPTGLSVMASAARIPFCGLKFWGCIAVVQWQGREFRLATYGGGRVMKRTETQLELKQGNLRLHAQVEKQGAFPLAAPNLGMMERTIHESPVSTVRFRFYQGGKLLFDEVSRGAGYEYVP